VREESGGGDRSLHNSLSLWLRADPVQQVIPSPSARLRLDGACAGYDTPHNVNVGTPSLQRFTLDSNVLIERCSVIMTP
jgi:hypothetical protein